MYTFYICYKNIILKILYIYTFIHFINVLFYKYIIYNKLYKCVEFYKLIIIYNNEL